MVSVCQKTLPHEMEALGDESDKEAEKKREGEDDVMDGSRRLTLSKLS